MTSDSAHNAEACADRRRARSRAAGAAHALHSAIRAGDQVDTQARTALMPAGVLSDALDVVDSSTCNNERNAFSTALQQPATSAQQRLVAVVGRECRCILISCHQKVWQRRVLPALRARIRRSAGGNRAGRRTHSPAPPVSDTAPLPEETHIFCMIACDTGFFEDFDSCFLRCQQPTELYHLQRRSHELLKFHQLNHEDT